MNSRDGLTVYVVTYFNRYPDDGFELGGVYSSERSAEVAGEEQRCAERDWESYTVNERAVRSGTDQDGDSDG